MKILSAAFAFTILLMTGLTFVPEVKAQNLISSLDDFEDDVLTQPPEGDFYTVPSTSGGPGTNCGSGGQQVDTTDDFASSGTQSVTFNSGPTGSPACFILNENPCATPNWEFSARIYLTAYTTVELYTMYSFQVGGGTTATNLPRVMVDQFGDVSIGTSTTISAGNMALNTWYTISFGPFYCTATAGQAREASVCFESTCTTQALPTGITTLRFFKFSHTGTGTQAIGYLDDLSLGAHYSPHPVEAEVTGLTNILGFDINKASTHLVTRSGTNPGPIVSYDAGNLAALGSVDSACSMQDGVLALDDGVGYFGCNGSGQINTLNFASSSMGNYNGLATDTIVLTSLGASIEQTFIHIRPCYSSWQVTFTGSNTFASNCFLIATTSGALYALGIQQDVLGNTDLELEGPVAYAPDTINEICSQYAGQFFVIDSATTTKGYLVNHIYSDFGTQSLTVTNNFNGATAINSASDIDCATTEGGITSGDKDRITIRKGVSSHAINTITGATLCNRAYNSATVVSISGDGHYLAVIANDGLDNANVGLLLNSTTCDTIGMFNDPASPVQMRTDKFAQSIWIQTTTSLHRVEVYEATTIVPISDIPETSSTSTSTSTGGGGFVGGSGDGSDCTGSFLGINISFIANSWSTTDTAIRWLLGLLLLSLIVWGFSKTGSAFLIIIAIILGTGIGIVFCLFPVWLLLVEIFVLLLAVGNMIFSGNNGE